MLSVDEQIVCCHNHADVKEYVRSQVDKLAFLQRTHCFPRALSSSPLLLYRVNSIFRPSRAQKSREIASRPFPVEQLQQLLFSSCSLTRWSHSDWLSFILQTNCPCFFRLRFRHILLVCFLLNLLFVFRKFNCPISYSYTIVLL